MGVRFDRRARNSFGPIDNLGPRLFGPASRAWPLEGEPEEVEIDELARSVAAPNESVERLDPYEEVEEAGGTTHYRIVPRQRTFTAAGGSRKAREARLRAEILTHVMPPENTSAMYGGQADLVNPWENHPAQVEGRMAIEFHREWRVEGRVSQAESVWVDPQTRLVIRTETRQFNKRTGQLEAQVVNDSYRYDEQLPPDAFDLPMKKH